MQIPDSPTQNPPTGIVLDLIDEEYEDLGKDTEYLEDLARILENLGGLDTLVQELIQNADDAKASEMCFDIRADGLVVDNDATFSDCGDQTAPTCPWKADEGRPCDLHAFRRLSGASKRGQVGTTGAFGIGFTAVYQVTDLPELVSAGQHIVIDETQDARGRARRCKGLICQCDHDRPGTRFILPWARDPDTALRRELRVDPIADDTPALLAAELETTVPRAMLFLRDLQRVEIRIEGALRRVFEREKVGHRRLITGGEQPLDYLVLTSDFAANVAGLRISHPTVVSGRETITTVAVPLHGAEQGLLYAGLPTHDISGFPFHINADFFPADDRRSLRWNSVPHATWNAAAVRGAAKALGDAMLLWRDTLGAQDLWASLRSAAAAPNHAAGDRRGDALRALKTHLFAHARATPIVWTLTEDWVIPGQARRLPVGTPAVAEDALSVLGLSLVHPVIAADVAVLYADVPVPSLGFEEALAILEQTVPTDGVCMPDELQAPFDSAESRDALLQTLATLAPDFSAVAVDRLRALVLAPEDSGRVGALRLLHRGSAADRELYGRVDAELLFVDDARLAGIDSRLVQLTQTWDCAAAVEHLHNLCISSAPELDDLLLDELIIWLARHDDVIRDDADLKAAVRSLPIWPTTHGRSTLDGVSLPSAGLQSLPLANTIELASIPHTRTFLDRTLGVKSLGFVTYCCEVLPTNLDAATSATKRRAVIQALGRIKQEVLDDERVRDALRELPLVECRDGRWRRVSDSYQPSPELRALLGRDDSHASYDPRRNSMARDVLEWLGLDREPRAADLLARLDELTAQPPTDASRSGAHEVLDHLASRHAEWDEAFRDALRKRGWMTAHDNPGWHWPPDLFQRANRNWFASQAMFHDAPKESEKSDFLRELGLPVQPPATLVTRHLLVLAQRQEPAPWTLYEYLDSHTADAELELVADEPCILVNQDGRYARPRHVFQSRHPFASRREILPQRLRGYTRLLEALDIDDEPSTADAVEVLEEIASEGPIAVHDIDVVHACWAELHAAVVAGAAPELAELSDQTVALDASDTLQRPSELFFNDAPTLARRLGDRLGDRLITRQDHTWCALREAGVRNLTDAVDVEILGTGDVLDATELVGRVRGRAGLLARVVDGCRAGAGAATRAHTHRLRIEATAELLVRYHLDDEDSEQEYHVRALYERDSDTLHVAVEDGRVAWTECAKELARAFVPEQLPHLIAPGLRAVLEPKKPQEAEAALNELDVPRLDDEQDVRWAEADDGESDWSMAEQQEAADDTEPDARLAELEPEADTNADEGALPTADLESEIGALTRPPPDDSGSERDIGDNVDQDDAHEEALPGEQQDGRTGQANPGSPETRADTNDRGRREPTTRTPGTPLGTHYLETFLIVEPQRTTSSIATRDELDNMAIDRAGTNAVLAHERSRGRDPLRKTHNWPGWDVESSVNDELVRLIEVKSIDGPWDAARARLSSRQFKEANAHGDLYWLYIVENARTTPTIWRLQDPGRRVHGFAYIPDWKRLAENDEAGASASAEDKEGGARPS